LKLADQKDDETSPNLEIESLRVVDQEPLRVTPTDTNRKRSTRQQSQDSSSDSSLSPPKAKERRLDESGSVSSRVRNKMNSSIELFPATESSESESETGLNNNGEDDEGRPNSTKKGNEQNKSEQSLFKKKVEYEPPRAYPVPLDARGRIKRSVGPKKGITPKKQPQPGEWINATGEPDAISTGEDSNIEINEDDDEDFEDEVPYVETSSPSRQRKVNLKKGG
jgi:hypothetical protein